MLKKFFEDFATANPGQKVVIKAYLDDINLVAKCPIVLEKAVQYLEKNLGEIGLEVNYSKCFWMGPTPPTEALLRNGTGFKYVTPDGAVRVLGGWLGGDGAVIKALDKACDEFNLLFDRLALAPKHLQSPLLAKCVITKIGFILRTHSPHLTEALCKRFDLLVRRTIADLAEVDLTDLAYDIASLPTRCGGLGLTRAEYIAAIAHDASKKNALLNAFKVKRRDGDCPSQKEGTRKMHDLLHNKVANHDPHTKAHIADCSRARAKWSTSILGRDKLETDAIFAAAFRGALNLPHRTLDIRNTKCPGCSITFKTPHEVVPHLRGCSQIPEHNVSARHTHVKLVLMELLRDAGFYVDPKEPREFASYKCGERTIYWDDFPDHKLNCATCRDGKQPHASGPDIRVKFTDGSCVIDVSIISVACRTYVEICESVDDAMESVIDRKEDSYLEAVQRKNETLSVLCLSANGAPGSGTLSIVRKAVTDSHKQLDEKDLLERIQTAVVFQSAEVLHNAERLLGAAVSSKRTPARMPLVKMRPIAPLIQVDEPAADELSAIESEAESAAAEFAATAAAELAILHTAALESEAACAAAEIAAAAAVELANLHSAAEEVPANNTNTNTAAADAAAAPAQSSSVASLPTSPKTNITEQAPAQLNDTNPNPNPNPIPAAEQQSPVASPSVSPKTDAAAQPEDPSPRSPDPRANSKTVFHEKDVVLGKAAPCSPGSRAVSGRVPTTAGSEEPFKLDMESEEHQADLAGVGERDGKSPSPSFPDVPDSQVQVPPSTEQPSQSHSARRKRSCSQRLSPAERRSQLRQLHRTGKLHRVGNHKLPSPRYPRSPHRARSQRELPTGLGGACASVARGLFRVDKGVRRRAVTRFHARSGAANALGLSRGDATQHAAVGAVCDVLTHVASHAGRDVLATVQQFATLKFAKSCKQMLMQREKSKSSARA